MAIMIHDVEQRSAEWLALRSTRVGGSNAATVGAATKKGTETAGRRDLRLSLAMARMGYPLPTPILSTPDIERGLTLEPEALFSLELRLGVAISPVGYVVNGDYGCSPDGLIDDGFVEVKCPRPAIHLAYFQNRAPGLEGIPRPYRFQLLHNLLVTGRQRGVFASYEQHVPERLRLYVHEISRGEVAPHIDAYEKTLEVFMETVQQTITELEELMDDAR
jgi:hypothetical protein